MPIAQFYAIKDNRYKVVTGQIDGTNPPIPGTIDRIFVCTTSGGVFTLNYLYYDNGIDWIEIVPFNELLISVTLDLLGGSTEFKEYRLYTWGIGDSSWHILSEVIIAGGDVQGPISSTDNAIVRFDSTTGKLIQNSNVILNDDGDIETSGTITSNLINGRDIATDGSNLDSHISDDSIHYVQTSIDHTNIQNIGSNTHAEIDDHISDGDNPHAVTKTQIGLSNVTNDSQLKRSASDFSSFTIKASPVSGDTILIEDSVDSNNKKYITIGGISHTILSNIGTNSHVDIDSHISDGTLHYTQSNIDHTSIQNIGTNSHTAIDTHISNISNPHTVTKTQVSLGNVTNDAQLKRSASDFSSFTVKSTPVSGDIILIEDSADSGSKKYITLANLLGNVNGPGSSTDNAIVRFDSTTGKLIQGSNVTINDTGDMHMNNHHITNAQTITFNDVGSVSPSGGTITCEFDVNQKIIADLDDNASLTIQLNTPIGPGNFVLVLKQGSSTATTSITWVTEGTHGLYGTLNFSTDLSARIFVGLFYDGTDWYALSSDMPQILMS
jgi:hypothetical protein